MAWTSGLGDLGLSGEYELPTDAKLQGTFEILTIDIFRKSPQYLSYGIVSDSRLYR
jgi:hypothetical protein